MNQDHCLVEQFEMIFRAHFSSVKFFINMFLKSEADAEDLAQDVFTKLWTNFETWQNNDGKEGYIYTLWQKMLHLILSSTKDWKMIIGRNK